MLVPGSEPQYPHDVGRAATRQLQPSFSFSAGRHFGTPYEKSTPKVFPPGAFETLNSLSSGGGGVERRGNPSPVLAKAAAIHVSNYHSPIGSSIWTGTGSPGNRSYYPLPLGRHTFSSRWTMPTVAAQPW